VDLSPAARAGIEDHVRLLLAWSGSINLTAARDAVELARRHVVDSLAALTVLRSWQAAGLLDIGTGAGFPGLPLALAASADALLVDAIGKKVRFVEAAATAATAGTPGRSARRSPRIRAVAARVEALAADPRQRGQWPVVTARAVASLAELIELALPMLEPSGRLVAWKRVSIGDRLGDAEMAAADRALGALGGGSLDVLDPGLPELPDHRLVVVRSRRPAPALYPRDPARRRREPW
jgi:16S rRNA (guanine527-N7)-methyltransferase